MRSIPIPAIYLVTDRRRLSPHARTLLDELLALDRVIDDAIGAGVDVIQIREGDLDAAPLTALVERACRAARGTRTQVVVNDRVDVAIAALADGVHLPSRGVPVARVSALSGVGLIGRSIHEPDLPSVADGADYVLFGTVFETRSKPGRSDLAGLAGLRTAARLFPVPVLAIGGVTPERAAECLQAGAAGIAAIAPFLPVGCDAGALGAARAVEAFRAAMAHARADLLE